MLKGRTSKEILYIIPREEVPLEVESLSTNFLIVDWKTCVLTENFMYYQVFRGDGSSKNYKVLSDECLKTLKTDVESIVTTSQGKSGIAIHMPTEKKYPLSQEMISKMLKKKLEVDHESSHAFELQNVHKIL
ncbi:hypothetical protein Tco_0613674 [Tanacetum coccineum]